MGNRTKDMGAQGAWDSGEGAITSVCQPAQGLSMKTVQGGHSPVWQAWSPVGWPQGRTREQGWGQAGGGVEHGSGGSRTVRPHVHASSCVMMCRQGGHGPLWQMLSQLWALHPSRRPHTRRQTCRPSASGEPGFRAGQQASSQRCRPQLFMAPQRRVHAGGAAGASRPPGRAVPDLSAAAALQGTLALVVPHAQWTVVVAVQSPQGPVWHGWGQVWPLMPHASRLPHTYGANKRDALPGADVE